MTRKVATQLMDAAAPGLPGQSYDLVTSSLVLFFLPDPPAALRAWLRLLRVGGRLAVLTFGAQDPLWQRLDELFVPYLPPRLLDARTSGASGPFSSDEGMERLVASAGFEAVRTDNLDLDVELHDVDAWHRFSWSHGQRVMWEAVPEPDRPALRAAASDLLEGSRDADGRIVLRQRVRFTFGERRA